VLALCAGLVGGSQGACDVPEPEVRNDTANRCPTHACDAYQGYAARCDELGVCILDEGLTYFLSVSVPLSSSFAPGLTYGFPPGTLLPNTIQVRPCLGCLRLPYPQVIYGELNATAGVSDAVGQPLGSQPSTTLPASGTLRPLFPIGERSVDARTLGLPFDLALSTPVPDDRPSAAPLGPFGTPKPLFRFLVPPARYELDVRPVETLAERYPPVAQSFTVSEQDRTATGLSAYVARVAEDNLERPVAEVRAEARDLTGFSAYVRLSGAQTRVSSRVRLAGRESRIALAMVRGERQLLTAGRTEFVIEPPEDVIAVPRLEVPILSGAELRQTYPELPPPVAITGGVVEDTPLGGAPRAVPGRVDFISTQISTVLAYPAPQLLKYRTSVETDVLGRFVTVLPPGTYRAIVTPGQSAFAARFRRTEQTVEVRGGVVSLRAKERVFLTGCARLADGRDAADMEVAFTPSPKLRVENVVEAAWPRAARVRTNLRGVFTAELDAGEYQWTLRPDDSASLPWVTSELRTCDSPRAGCTSELAIEVPPPIPVVFRVVTPGQLGGLNPPISDALLRAFGPVGEGGTDTHFLELGSARTDATGRATLFLAPNRVRTLASCAR
jgi:hypothetical protein